MHNEAPAHLRFAALGELTALTRQRIDLQAGTVEVVEQALELSGGTRMLGPPKTHSGRRTVTLSAFVVDELADHMHRFVGSESEAVVLTGPKGAPLRRGSWNGKWNAVRKAVGCDGLRFQDLRHTGNTLAAATGASTKELMARVGHSSARAALHYRTPRKSVSASTTIGRWSLRGCSILASARRCSRAKRSINSGRKSVRHVLPPRCWGVAR